MATVKLRVDVPDPSSLEGLNIAVIPSGALTVRSTVPVPLFWKEMVRVAVAEPPACTRMFSGFIERVKSGLGVTLTLTVIV